MGLRLVSTLCCPHTFRHCRSEMNHLATYILSCSKSEGCHYRHAAVNDIMYRILALAHILSRLKPSHLNHSDGKRPDGVIMTPWKNCKLLVWDATCPDTLDHPTVAMPPAVLGQWLPQLRLGRRISIPICCLATFLLPWLLSLCDPWEGRS